MSPKLEDYDVMGIIGSGSFGTCYKVRNRNTNEYFVWKAIDYGNLTESRKQLLVSEVNLLSELNHPNIVKYYNRILHKETTTLYIIMEWCQGGDLLSVIKHAKKLGTWLEEGFIWRALYQTGRALQACHTRLGRVTVLHRDIKPANIFLDHRGNIKLGDFGLARVLQGDNEYSQTIIGTPYYMSPEVVKGTKYNRKSDIWALGCLIYELCALVQPFSGSDIQELNSNIKTGKYNRIPDRYSENLVKMIQLMLTVQHEFRPTIEMVLHHPVVVTNVSKYEKAKLVESEEKQLSGIVQLMKSVHLEPEEVSENTFKEKWLYRLETLRRKEAKVKEREEAVEKRERIVARREKEVMLLERNARDKISRAEVYLHRSRQPVTGLHEDADSSLEAPSETSFMPTTAKVNPAMLPKLNFVRTLSERKTRKIQFDPKPQVRALHSDTMANIKRQTQHSTLITSAEVAISHVGHTGEEQNPRPESYIRKAESSSSKEEKQKKKNHSFKSVPKIII